MILGGDVLFDIFACCPLSELAKTNPPIPRMNTFPLSGAAFSSLKTSGTIWTLQKLKSLIPSFSGFLSLLAGPTAKAQSAYFQAVTNLNPVAYWPLQETVQPPAADVETIRGL